MKWHQQVILIDWKKKKIYSKHTFLQTITVIYHAESKNKMSFFMCLYKIIFLPILKILSVSNICISHSALLFFLLYLYSLILLHQSSRLNAFQLALIFFNPYGCFLLLYVFHFHSSHSFQSHFPLLSDCMWALLQA